jgi:hypothetical protein
MFGSTVKNYTEEKEAKIKNEISATLIVRKKNKLGDGDKNGWNEEKRDRIKKIS